MTNQRIYDFYYEIQFESFTLDETLPAERHSFFFLVKLYPTAVSYTPCNLNYHVFKVGTGEWYDVGCMNEDSSVMGIACTFSGTISAKRLIDNSATPDLATNLLDNMNMLTT